MFGMFTSRTMSEGAGFPFESWARASDPVLSLDDHEAGRDEHTRDLFSHHLGVVDDHDCDGHVCSSE
jgi:hypothetical protein